MKGYQKTKVLITVMTYPHPSRGYQELVCTAGITEAAEWVRLYPVDYRYRPRHQKFKKYQWIEVALAPRGSGNDQRKESRKPDLDSISILGPRLTSDNGWRERRAILDLTIEVAARLRLICDTAALLANSFGDDWWQLWCNLAFLLTDQGESKRLPSRESTSSFLRAGPDLFSTHMVGGRTLGCHRRGR